MAGDAVLLALQDRSLGDARPAPRREHVQHHDLAAVAREALGLGGAEDRQGHMVLWGHRVGAAGDRGVDRRVGLLAADPEREQGKERDHCRHGNSGNQEAAHAPRSRVIPGMKRAAGPLRAGGPRVAVEARDRTFVQIRVRRSGAPGRSGSQRQCPPPDGAGRRDRGFVHGSDVPLSHRAGPVSGAASCWSAGERDDERDDHDHDEAGGGDADRALPPPELGLRAIALVPPLWRGADPVVVILEACHRRRLPAPRRRGAGRRGRGYAGRESA